jgi:hypothetical protein
MALTEKLLPLFIISTTSIISIIHVFTREYRNTDEFLNVVQTNRASVGLVVQVLSSILGLLQTMVATSLFKFATRMRFTEHPTTLGTLTLWTALSQPTTNFKLTKRGLLLTVVVLLVAHAPGALWAGALTPVLTTITRDGSTIQIPTYTNDTRYNWDGEFQLQGNDVWNYVNNCTLIDNELGFISSCPVPHIQGSLLNSGSSATTLSSAPRNHSKVDNPSWSFIGRSYGVASAEGIVPPENMFAGITPLAYSYTRTGYDVAVNCWKNSSADFGIQWITTDEYYLTTWEIQGYLPNSVPGNNENYPSVTWYSTTNGTQGGPSILGWSAVVNTEAANRNMIAIAAGGTYKNLNQTQCSVDFKPHLFNISVNTNEKTIIVSPDLNQTAISDIEPTGVLGDVVMWSLNLLSRMTPSLYDSLLGNTLQNNVLNLIARPGLNMTDEEGTLSAISDSFSAILDDILVAFGSAQLALANSSTPTPVIVTLQAVQIGQNIYSLPLQATTLFSFY